MKWKEAISNTSKKFKEELLRILESTYTIWYNWHKIICSGKNSISNDRFFQGEMDNGINFCKALNTN